MKNAKGLVFAAGFLAGLAAGAGLLGLLMARKTAGNIAREKVAILVAASDIRQEERIQASHFRVKLIDRGAYVPSMMMTAAQKPAFVGYIAALDIPAGAPILLGALKLY